MKICVLQPDYSSSKVDYRHYDPPRDLAALLPAHEVHHLFLDKRRTYRQLRDCATMGFEIFVNLCEGYLDWDVPCVDVILALDLLELPYTGPSALLYDPSKPLMKYVAHTAGVRTPAHGRVRCSDDSDAIAATLPFPLFVKPAHAGDSRGVNEQALVHDVAALRAQVDALLPKFPELLVEQYVDGREFTVLVVADVAGRGELSFWLWPGRKKPTGLASSNYTPRGAEASRTCSRVLEAPCGEPLDARVRRYWVRADATSGMPYLGCGDAALSRACYNEVDGDTVLDLPDQCRYRKLARFLTYVHILNEHGIFARGRLGRRTDATDGADTAGRISVPDASFCVVRPNICATLRAGPVGRRRTCRPTRDTRIASGGWHSRGTAMENGVLQARHRLTQVGAFCSRFSWYDSAHAPTPR